MMQSRGFFLTSFKLCNPQNIRTLKINKLNSVIVLGLVAIIGIITVQLLWTKQAFNTEGKKFSQKVHITLLHVVDRLYQISNNEFPLKNPINKISNDYYIVNVNNDFDAGVLEYCLKTEFERSNLLTDFEYAIYKCESDEMVYGNYVSFNNKVGQRSLFHFPKQKNLVYYFSIRFPNETGYLLSSLKFWGLLSGLLVLILLIYVYSIFTILQQKKYSELQKDFINNMTHEFKTPLSSILIASGYLIRQEKIRSDAKLEKYTEIIISQSKNLNRHIEKILDLAKSDHTTFSLDKKELSVPAVINAVIENIKLRHEQLQVSVHAPAGDTRITADEFHFSNLVYNLIDNAIKYCDDVPAISIRVVEQGRYLKLEFTDNGIGVPAKNLSFIFDRFYRIPGRKSSEVNGFGLGLYYVKKICLLHQWKITAINNLLQGITISLLIPKQA
jgi:two-component system phosphate regulon sensor histidine kinase PhoR